MLFKQSPKGAEGEKRRNLCYKSLESIVASGIPKLVDEIKNKLCK
jgi:hypothetical protein